MELQDLKYFCVAAELEHITKAAEILDVSQPFLTKVIQRLENELGTPLFDHRGRLVALNSYGQVVYRRAKEILAATEALQDEIGDMLDMGNRSISIMTNTMIYMSDILAEFNAEFPNYMVTVTSTHLRRIKSSLRSRKIDLALTTPPLAENISSGLRTIPVLKDHIGLLLPPEHRFCGKTDLKLEDLRNEQIIISPPGFGMRNSMEKIFASHNLEMHIVIETGEVNDIISFVQKGIGAAFMPVTYIKKHPELRKDYIFLKDMPEPDPIGLSYYEDAYIARGKRLFRDLVIDFFLDPKNSILPDDLE